jgi:hypothetical protein
MFVFLVYLTITLPVLVSGDLSPPFFISRVFGISVEFLVRLFPNFPSSSFHFYSVFKVRRFLSLFFSLPPSLSVTANAILA